MSENILDLFHSYTASWFTNALGNPTIVQEEAWPSIAAGNHTLVSAPTGTGKTLSAFLVFIDRLMEEARKGTLKQELRLIYVSPLKSLAGDIRENLSRPLNGILKAEADAGTPVQLSELTIAIRTGDTPQKDRTRMIKHPPHILITTPESLYLMLTSASGQKILHTARAIIIDELHALIDSKRGAHLMLSIARLDNLCKQPLQRIGLSATIEPLPMAAEYLSPDPVTIVAPKMHKEIKLLVTSPLSDQKSFMKEPIWQELSKTVFQLCATTRSAIAFVEGRAYAEKLAYYMNQLGGDGFARTHHGSLSKEQRFEVEHALRNGTLRLLCATSSMELGIDVGDIDQVFQIGCPRSISSTMQRLGRAGHNPNRISVMYLFPREPSEGLYCGLTAEVARTGGIEYSKPPKLCFDVLAQHLVSMANGDGYDVLEVMELLLRAYPFREVTKEDVCEILSMLAGDYEHNRDIPVRPRIIYDRIHEHVSGDAYSRMLAVSAGGTIPDRGLYTAKTESGVKLGELDEEFVFESRIGDRFLLGTFAWQIVNILKDTVIVTQTATAGARLPFWHGDMKGRRLRTGIAFGSILRRLAAASETGALQKALEQLGLDEIAANRAKEYLERQLDSTGVLPDDHTIIVEHFKDENGNHQMMVHSIFGRQVNEPLALLVKEAACRNTEAIINLTTDDDGFLLFPYDGNPLPEGLLYKITPDTAENIIKAILPTTPLFNMNFRYNSARAMLMGVRSNKRQPLWIQRMRSAELLASLVREEKHPIIRETARECLEDYFDLLGVKTIIRDIQSGNIQVHEIYLDTPSPMSLPLRRQTEASMMYDYAPTPIGIHLASAKALEQVHLLKPGTEQLDRVSERRKLPEDAQQLHSLLMIEGDLIAGELEVPIEWLEALTKTGQAKYIEPGLWIAAEHEQDYQKALDNDDHELRLRMIQRALRYRGAQTAKQIAERYFLKVQTVQDLLTLLYEQKKVVEQEGIYYHAKLYERALRETVQLQRKQVKTYPPESFCSLMVNRMYLKPSPNEQLAAAIHALCDQYYPVALWESVLLPARVSNYRPELLDTFLSGGTHYWQFSADSTLCFHRYEDIDWETTLTSVLEELKDSEKIIYEALMKRGASFLQRLTGLTEGSPYDILMNLTERGFVFADTFLPVRQWLSSDKLKNGTLKQRISARSKMLSNGRWEVARPLISLSIEDRLHREFDRAIILSRETIRDIPWGTALETLRIWEYTGRVRRGYFIEGLSGIQFIRDKDYESTMISLEQPHEQIYWLNASDPSQPYGKFLPHYKDRSFVNVIGSAVALNAGVPVAVLERQGKNLRVFDMEVLPDALKAFVQQFHTKRIFSSLKRIVIKDYEEGAKDALESAGFIHELSDYVLYRSYT